MSKNLSETLENLSKINFYGNAGKPAITEYEPIIYESYYINDDERIKENIEGLHEK